MHRIQQNTHQVPFNSRPHAEVDLSPQIMGYMQGTFNSRPHAEVDCGKYMSNRRSGSFNSRPHAEVDYLQSICCKSIDLSTHDLTQRSTPELARLRICIISFNSRPHAEVDFPRLWGHRRWRPFNSRPHAEVDNRGIQRSVEGFFLSTHDLTQRSTR